MKLALRASIVYFLLIFIYKLFGDPNNLYWVNYYWLVSSVYFMLVFIDVKKYCVLKTYTRIASVVSYYWAVMAGLRLFLFFKIELYSSLMHSAGRVTIGAASILASLIYLTAKIWHQK